MKKTCEPNWSLICDEYVRSEKSLLTISNEFNVPKSTVYRRCKEEGWRKKRAAWKAQVSTQAAEGIMSVQVQEHIRIYEATRKTADLLVEQLMRAATDPDGLYRHVVQMEEETEEATGRERTKSRKRWVESRTLDTINGRNASDLARALKDLAMMSRTLDGIMDAAQKAKLDLERERLEIDRVSKGLDNDDEHESGVVLLPARDMSLLESAIPDPSDTDENSPETAKETTT